jgi:hypothetical protein
VNREKVSIINKIIANISLNNLWLICFLYSRHVLYYYEFSVTPVGITILWNIAAEMCLQMNFRFIHGMFYIINICFIRYVYILYYVKSVRGLILYYVSITFGVVATIVCRVRFFWKNRHKVVYYRHASALSAVCDWMIDSFDNTFPLVYTIFM